MARCSARGANREGGLELDSARASYDRPDPFPDAVSQPVVCVVNSKQNGPAYVRLAECGLRVAATVPALSRLDPRGVSAYDCILVGCSERMLLNPTFRSRIREVSSGSCVVAVVPTATSGAGVEAARLGFAGLVASDVAPSALERTIAAAMRGDSAFPRSSFAGLARLAAIGSAPRRGRTSALTPRQEQVVRLIARGATDRELAHVLGISESTAHKHVQNAMRRVNARSRSQLVATIGARSEVSPPRALAN